MQRTIKRELKFKGVGLHTGRTISVIARPAGSGVGIQFVRVDVAPGEFIAARPASVLDTRLATRLGKDEALSISTVEHFLAALYGFGIDNLIVEIDGPEMPILDGSAAPFLTLLDEAGVEEISGSERRAVVIKDTLECVDAKDPTRFIRLEPAKQPQIIYAIDFGDATIGKQHVTLDWNGFAFCEQFSFARTFCFEDEVAAMQKMGLARGGSLENAVVVSRRADVGVLNTQGLRDREEFAKHKALDCIGDLMLVGMPVIGRVVASKAGHDLHTQMAGEVVRLIAERARSVQLVESGAKNAAWAVALRFPKSLSEMGLGGAHLVMG